MAEATFAPRASIIQLVVSVMTGKKKTGVENIEKIEKEDKAYGRVAE